MNPYRRKEREAREAAAAKEQTIDSPSQPVVELKPMDEEPVKQEATDLKEEPIKQPTLTGKQDADEQTAVLKEEPKKVLKPKRK